VEGCLSVIQLELAARRFFEKMAIPSEQVRIGEILRELTYEPYFDGEIKLSFNHPSFVDALIYYDGEFGIIYEILGPTRSSF
jgi:hypothetical protein